MFSMTNYRHLYAGLLYVDPVYRSTIANYTLHQSSQNTPGNYVLGIIVLVLGKGHHGL